MLSARFTIKLIHVLSGSYLHTLILLYSHNNSFIRTLTYSYICTRSPICNFSAKSRSEFSYTLKGDLTPMQHAICDIAKKYRFAIWHMKNNRDSYTDAM